MKLLFFLWNPGQQYTKSRHNAGFIVGDELAKERNCLPRILDTKAQANITSTTYEWEKRLLVKPQTFMNLSGNSVSYLMTYYKLTPADIIVIHDDIELIANKIMLKQWWSARGQNGIKHIIQKIGTPDFARVRIGIGRPTHDNIDIASHVLTPFTPDEYNTLLLDTHTVISHINTWHDTISWSLWEKN